MYLLFIFTLETTTKVHITHIILKQRMAETIRGTHNELLWTPPYVIWRQWNHIDHFTPDIFVLFNWTLTSCNCIKDATCCSKMPPFQGTNRWQSFYAEFLLLGMIGQGNIGCHDNVMLYGSGYMWFAVTFRCEHKCSFPTRACYLFNNKCNILIEEAISCLLGKFTYASVLNAERGEY